MWKEILSAILIYLAGYHSAAWDGISFSNMTFDVWYRSCPWLLPLYQENYFDLMNGNKNISTTSQEDNVRVIKCTAGWMQMSKISTYLMITMDVVQIPCIYLGIVFFLNQTKFAVSIGSEICIPTLPSTLSMTQMEILQSILFSTVFPSSSLKLSKEAHLWISHSPQHYHAKDLGPIPLIRHLSRCYIAVAMSYDVACHYSDIVLADTNCEAAATAQ